MRIRLDRVARRYGDREVLRDVDLELDDARTVVVAGANGSGKSTLLRLLAGVAVPSRGRIDGLPARVGYLPERFTPPPLLRADAYLRHVGRMGRMSTATAQDRAATLLDRLGLRPDPHRRLGSLSKGNLQKVGIAAAFLAGHPLVVLDEPRTGLETAANAPLDELVAEHVAAGGLVVASEHDPARLAAAGELLRVRDGVVVREAVTDRRFRVRAIRAGVEHTAIAIGGTDGELRRLLADGWSIVEVQEQ